MSYKDFVTAANRYAAMRSDCQQIYCDVVQAEDKLIEHLSKEEREVFRTHAREALNFDIGRSWGSSSFSNSLKEIGFKENGARLNFEKEDYCRSCYMGTIRDTIFLPDWLIDAYHDNDYRTFEAALGRFIGERAAQVETFAAKKAAQEAEEKERKRQLAEERDRAAFERLKKKFGE